jgi:hypothetical protein
LVSSRNHVLRVAQSIVSLKGSPQYLALSLLLQLACDKLRREHIVRLGLTRLERFVATARQQAHDETWRRLAPLVSPERQTFLNALLTPNPSTGRTLHSWLRQEAVSPAASQIIATLHKISFLHDAGVDQWNLAHLNPNRVKWLGQIGWKATNQYLQRMTPERRYPVLLAFLQQALRLCCKNRTGLRESPRPTPMLPIQTSEQ